jgi:hypothetical protein
MLKKILRMLVILAVQLLAEENKFYNQIESGFANTIESTKKFVNKFISDSNETNPNEMQNNSNEPSWLDNSEKEANGKLSAIGCASKHINGEVGQRKLALQRAIDEIAMQKKTKVQTVSYRTKTLINSDKSSKSQSSSLQEVENTGVSSKVMEYYKKQDGDICVWVIEN